MNRPRAYEGKTLYCYRLPGGRREVISGERAGAGETIMSFYAGLPPKKGTARVKAAGQRLDHHLDPARVRGLCPLCGGPVVSTTYHESREFFIVWECWNSLGEKAACTYRKAL